MAENYTGNSRKDRDKPAPDEEKREVKDKVVEGAVKPRKRSLGRRFTEAMTGSDAQSVGNYILIDIIIPNVKSLISEVVSNGVDRTLWGDQGGRRRNGNGNRQHTPYSSMAKQATNARPDPREALRARTTQNFSDLVLETRADAEVVIDRMRDNAREYGSVSVADFYDFCDVTSLSNFQDHKWGWELEDLRGVEPKGSPRNGYVLNLPRPVEVA